MEFNGVKNSMESKAKITIERPNRIAIRQRNSPLGSDIICDGEQLFDPVLIPTEAVFSITAHQSRSMNLLTNPIGDEWRSAVMVALLDIFSTDPYETLMQGVTSTTYAGREKTRRC